LGEEDLDRLAKVDKMVEDWILLLVDIQICLVKWGHLMTLTHSSQILEEIKILLEEMEEVLED
jgi:hypothetical protein